MRNIAPWRYKTLSHTQLHKQESLFFVKEKLVAPLLIADVSDEVAEELLLPICPQMLDDVEGPMLARPATLKDPGTPDRIVMEQHSVAHFWSHPWCKMCLECRGRDSPHREQAKMDAVVPQLQFDYEYMGDGGLCRLRASLWESTPPLEPSTRRWYQIPRRWTCPVLSWQQPSVCVTWGIHSTQKINDMSYNQLISDPSTYVKKRTQPSEDSTFSCVTWMTWWAGDQMNNS